MAKKSVDDGKITNDLAGRKTSDNLAIGSSFPVYQLIHHLISIPGNL